MKAAIFLIILFIICLATSVSLAKENTLIFSTAEPHSNVLKVYTQFLTMAYKEIGYQTRFVKLPGKRAYATVNNATYDGLVLSSKHILYAHPNIVVVDIPLATIETSLYSINQDLVITDKKSLSKYRIGILRGYPLTLKITQGMNRQIVNNYESLFSILDRGRVDVAMVLGREAQRFLLKHPEFSHIKPLKKSIYSLELFHFLNKKHENLIPQIKPIIQHLLDEGVLDRLYAEYEKS